MTPQHKKNENLKIYFELKCTNCCLKNVNLAKQSPYRVAVHCQRPLKCDFRALTMLKCQKWPPSPPPKIFLRNFWWHPELPEQTGSAPKLNTYMFMHIILCRFISGLISGPLFWSEMIQEVLYLYQISLVEISVARLRTHYFHAYYR